MVLRSPRLRFSRWRSCTRSQPGHLSGLRICSRDTPAALKKVATQRKLESYLRRYMQFFVQSFYNPNAYQDAGLSDPHEWRRRLMCDTQPNPAHLAIAQLERLVGHVAVITKNVDGLHHKAGYKTAASTSSRRHMKISLANWAVSI